MTGDHQSLFFLFCGLCGAAIIGEGLRLCFNWNLLSILAIVLMFGLIVTGYLLMTDPLFMAIMVGIAGISAALTTLI